MLKHLLVIGLFLIAPISMAYAQDMSMGPSGQYPAQPPTAGVAAPNDMSQLPSPGVNRDSQSSSSSQGALNPGSQTQFRPACDLDTSMSPQRSVGEGMQSLPEGSSTGIQSGEFRCKT